MLSYKKIFIISLCCFIITVIFGFVAYQSIFEYAIKDQVSLHKNNYIRRFYLKFPIPLNFNVYFFNVTNPDEVYKGGTPVLKEIGPFCYDLYKERIDIEDNEAEDSLTYTPHDTFVFSEERSGLLKDDDYVTVLHPFVVGLVNYVATNTPQYISILDEALTHLFPNQSIYVTAKVKDLLFDGLLVDCSAKDLAVMAVCGQIKRRIPGIKVDERGNIKVGLFSQKNGTVPTRITVNRGIRNSERLGEVMAIDNATKSETETSEECKKFRGTDGWIFPPFSQYKQQIWFHPSDFCMNLHADFVEKTTSNSISVRKFQADFGDQCGDCSELNPCPPQGLMDLTQCVKIPLYVSLPHFAKSDENLLKDVQGLEPDVEKHVTQVLLEETLSFPIEAQIKAQFNFPLKNNSKIRFMTTVPNVVHPMLWVELGVTLNGWYLKMVQAFLSFLLVLEILKYLCLVTSFGGIAYAAYLYLNNKKLYSIKDAIVLKNSK